MTGHKPLLLEERSSTWFILMTVGSGVFTDMFLYGVIIPVIPRAITSRASVSPDDRQKWVTILLAVEATFYLVFSPIFGIVADYTAARRMPYLVGLLLLATSMALQTASHSLGMYIAGRALQGASAAAVWVIGLAFVVDTVDTLKVGEYMGYVSWAMSFGALMGPILGGVVYDTAGYYAVFGMVFGVIGTDICLRLTMIEKKVAAKWHNTPTNPSSHHSKRSQCGFLGLESESSLSKSFESIPTIEPQSTRTAAAHRYPSERLNQTQLRIEGKPKIPIIFILLHSPRLLFTLWSCMVPMMILAAFESTLPLVVQDIFGWSSLGSGLIFIPLSIPTFLSPIMGMISDRYGARLSATAGLLLMIPPLVCLRFVTHNSIDQKILLCALLSIIGVMLTLLMAPCMAEIERVVEDKERDDPAIFRGKSPTATAYALFNMAYAFGILVGPLWGGYIRDETNFGTMGWSLAIISGATAISTFLMVGGWVGQKKRPQTGVEDVSIRSMADRPS